MVYLNDGEDDEIQIKDSKDWYIIHSSNQSCMTEVNGNVSDDEVEDEFEEDLDVEDDEDNAKESDEQ